MHAMVWIQGASDGINNIVCMIVSLKNSPDVHADHIFSVRLLDHVVCWVATSKCNVDVASSDDVCIIIKNGVGEHDVSLIRCLEKQKRNKTKQNKTSHHIHKQ